MASPASIPITSPSERQKASGSQELSEDAGNQKPSIGTNTLKPPKEPEKPFTPFKRYSRQVRDKVKAANQELKLREIDNIVYQMWRKLPDGDKKAFFEEYETEKIEYQRTSESHHNSPTVQSLITVKSEAKHEANVKESASEGGMSASASSEVCLAAAAPAVAQTPTALTKKQRKKMAKLKKQKEARDKKKEKTEKKHGREKKPSESSDYSDAQYRSDSDGFQANISWPGN